jgi:hypothetical protein
LCPIWETSLLRRFKFRGGGISVVAGGGHGIPCHYGWIWFALGLSFFCKELSQGFLGGLHVSWFNLGLLIAGDCSISWSIWDGEHLNICMVWLSLCALSLSKWIFFVLSFWFLSNIIDWAKCAWFYVHLGFYV